VDVPLSQVTDELVDARRRAEDALADLATTDTRLAADRDPLDRR